MQDAAYDVVAVGNAIVDILHTATDNFLADHEIAKGAMTLIDEERALYLPALFNEATVAAGGSAANTATGVASLGGAAAFIGKVADDALGRGFTEAFRGVGATYHASPRHGPPGTARCLIVITPDGQRSMSTYLGMSTLLDSSDVDGALIRAGAITFLEGYLFDRDEAKTAFIHAAEIARAANRKVAVTLSDTFCVDRHRASFRHLVAHHIDILLSNESELCSLYQTDFDAALDAARSECPLVVATRSEKGSIICAKNEIHTVAAAPVARVVDSTGAGDQYAAGFLYGYAKGRPLPQCGALGSLAAAEVISHIGPRPEVSLKDLAARAGL
jgi:sugar/nucleoside kinase (ribokinase family)